MKVSIGSVAKHFGVIVNKSEEPRFEDDLVQDMLEIITVFSERLYGAGSRKNQKLFDIATFNHKTFL